MKAKLHNESLFKGRQITVIPKRKNIPGQGSSMRGGRQMAQFANMLAVMMGGRGMRGRGGFRGAGHRGGPPTAGP